MGQIIEREFTGCTRKSVFNIYPLGDIHIGAVGCNESKLKAVVRRIADDPNGYWIGMGDYADYIQLKDPRYVHGVFAPWIGIKHLGDITKAQTERFLSIIEPIAGKCLAMLKGNHETAIEKHYEREIFHELVGAIAEGAAFQGEFPLSLGYSGWLNLKFKRRGGGGTSTITMNLHHGYAGGRKPGGKMNHLSDRLGTHDCDIFLMGHSHNGDILQSAVEHTDGGGNVRTRRIFGAYTGSFYETTGQGENSYAEIKGYPPLPSCGIVITLKPCGNNDDERIVISTR